MYYLDYSQETRIWEVIPLDRDGEKFQRNALELALTGIMDQQASAQIRWERAS